MAKKSLVDLSMTGESDIEIQQQQLNYEQASIARQESVPIQNGNIIYKLVDTKRKGRVYIDGIDDVINPKTGRQERIWLLSGANSIWSSELTEILQDKDYVRTNRRSLQFEGGILRVPRWDTLAIEFITNCRHFIDNPSRRTGSKFEFFEHNPQKQAKAALDREMLELDMATEAKVMPIDKAKKLASFFGIVFYDELGMPKADDAIRRELMLFAKRDPQRFKANIDSKEVEISYLIRRCILDAKIDLGGASGNITFANGGFICKLPLSRKAPEYLLEFAMTNSPEGRSFLDELERISK